MPGAKHFTSVWPGPGGVKYQYRCTCGATGYVTPSRAKAQEMGDQHTRKAR